MKKYIGTLSDEELSKLKKALSLKYVTAGLSIIAAGLIVQIILMSEDFNEKKIIIAWSLFGIVSLAIVIFTLFYSRDLRTDINESSKTVREFIIENKGFFEDDEPGIAGSYITYFIVSEEYKFVVDKTLFDKAEKGDTLIKQYSTNSLVLLKYEIRKKRGN